MVLHFTHQNDFVLWCGLKITGMCYRKLSNSYKEAVCIKSCSLYRIVRNMYNLQHLSMAPILLHSVISSFFRLFWITSFILFILIFQYFYGNSTLISAIINFARFSYKLIALYIGNVKQCKDKC